LRTLPYHTHAGAHSNLSDLSWTIIELDGTVSSRAVVRVRALADGVPALEPLCRTIDANPHPTPAQVIRWLDIIEGAP